MEAQCWLAQSLRSDAWTYYEATPQLRQEALLNELRQWSPPEYADWYDRGMADWTDQVKIRAVDSWIKAHEDDCFRWLRQLIGEARNIVMELTA